MQLEDAIHIFRDIARKYDKAENGTIHHSDTYKSWSRGYDRATFNAYNHVADTLERYVLKQEPTKLTPSQAG